jgi:hypothetical protein
LSPWWWLAVVVLVVFGAVGSLVTGAATLASRSDAVESLPRVPPGTAARVPLASGAQAIFVEAHCGENGSVGVCSDTVFPTVIVLAPDGRPADLVSSPSADGRTVERVATFTADVAGRYSVVVGTSRDPRVTAVIVGPDPLADRWALVWPPLTVLAAGWLPALVLAVLLARGRLQPAPTGDDVVVAPGGRQPASTGSEGAA